MNDKKLAIEDEQLDQVTGGTVLPYIVLAGDSLMSIAKRFHVSVEQLCRWNKIPDKEDVLEVGKKLVVKF